MSDWILEIGETRRARRKVGVAIRRLTRMAGIDRITAQRLNEILFSGMNYFLRVGTLLR